MRGEGSELLHRPVLFLRRGGAPQSGDRPLGLDVRGQGVQSENPARMQGPRRRRGSGGRGRGRRLRCCRYDGCLLAGPRGLEPVRAAAGPRERDRSEGGVLGRERPDGDAQQGQHVVCRHPGGERHSADAPGVQESRELGDLRVARDQVLPLPVQTRRSHPALDRAEPRQGGQRFGEVMYGLHDRRMGGRVEAPQSERGPDRAERAVDSCRVQGHGATA